MRNHKKTEIHGHRGCRGYYPENTIEGFIHALSFPIDAIEMDVVISKDFQVVVSHEHYFHHKKCLHPDLTPITEDEEKNLVLFQFDYSTIQLFDCGLIAHPQFPQLRNQRAYKPLLKEVIIAAESYININNRAPITYNIEIKSDAEQIGWVQPDYETYVKVILNTIVAHNISERCIIQSFDKEILRTCNQLNPLLKLSLLIEDTKDPLWHINELGFYPAILASDFRFLDLIKVKQLKDKGLMIYAFTVNEVHDILRMLSYDIDAVITDYPDRALACLENYK